MTFVRRNDSNVVVQVEHRFRRADTAQAALLRRIEPPTGYSIWLMMSNIGMYSAMTAAPTAPPMIAMRRGSMSAVSASTVAVTSLL